jgi:hypothetical protein
MDNDIVNMFSGLITSVVGVIVFYLIVK